MDGPLPASKRHMTIIVDEYYEGPSSAIAINSHLSRTFKQVTSIHRYGQLPSIDPSRDGLHLFEDGRHAELNDDGLILAR